MKIVLVGAGSIQFGLGTLGDIFTSKTLTGSEITLLDINAKALDVVLQTTKDFIQSHGLRYTVTGVQTCALPIYRGGQSFPDVG